MLFTFKRTNFIFTKKKKKTQEEEARPFSDVCTVQALEEAGF